MRKLCLILALFLLLSGCGIKDSSLPEGFTPAYEQTTLPLEDDLILHLRSNGTIIVGATYNYQDSGNLYLLEPEESSVSTKLISDFHGLRYYDLLAVDGNDGIWIGGTREDDTYAALRLDAQGEALLSINFEPGVPDHGITSLGWDQRQFSLGQLAPLCPGMSDSTYYGPEGTLGFYSWQEGGYVVEILSPKAE